MKLHIQKFHPYHLEECIQLVKSNTPNYFHPEETADYENYLVKEIEDYFVVMYQDQLVAAGGINYGFDNGNKARISWDVVSPKYQGRNIGGQLLQYRLNYIFKQNIKIAEVRTSNLVYPFYQKFGFKIMEQRKNYWGENLDMVRMELKADDFIF